MRGKAKRRNTMFSAILDYTRTCASNKISRKYSKRTNCLRATFNINQKLLFFLRSKTTDLELTKSGILYFIYSVITFVCV